MDESNGGWGHQPALDGLRGIAVALVLAFHLGVPWVPGGYLGVSVFFTLSGFLITSLLLSEHTRTGRLAIRRFYVRRVRRLLPAAVLCLAAVTALLATGVIAKRADAQGEVLGGVFDVANWHALLGHHSYADLFRAPGPLDHFWSLAIEEQFYLVWPLALCGMLAVGRRGGRTRSMTPPLAALFVAFAIAAPVTASLWSADAAYFASWARFAEILAGALLASVVAKRALPSGVAVLAPLCLGIVLLASVLTPSASGWAYEGGLPLFALVSAGLIAGLQREGPVRSMLSWRPLVQLGAISYGVYLFHWPVFVVLDEARLGYGGLRLGALRMTVTMMIACASYALLERPIRTRTTVARPATSFVGAAAALVLVAAAAVAFVPLATAHRTSHGGGPVVLGGQAPATGSAVAAPSAPGPAAATSPSTSTNDSGALAAPASNDGGAPGPAAARQDPTGGAPGSLPPSGANTALVAAQAMARRPRTVAVLGDSVPDWLVKDAAPSFTRTDLVVIDAAHEACDGMVDEPRARGRDGEDLVPPASCQPWPVSYPPVLEQPSQPVDVALLMVGQAPTVDRFVDGRWISTCDGTQWYMDDLQKRITYLEAHSAQTVMVLPSWGGTLITWFLPADHAQRYACVRRDMRALAQRMHVPVIDLAEELCPAGPVEPCNQDREQDGLHIDPEDAPAVLEWLLEQLPPEPWHSGGSYTASVNPWAVSLERLGTPLGG